MIPDYLRGVLPWENIPYPRFYLVCPDHGLVDAVEGGNCSVCHEPMETLFLRPIPMPYLNAWEQA